jgi:hypothetical protein
VTSTVVQKTQGGTPGFIRQGGTYRVYANSTDAGSPASGLHAMTGNLSSLTTVQTSAALTAGAFSVFGTSYERASAALTANATLTAGAKTYTLTSTDEASNSRTQTAFPVTVDNTVPAASSIQTTNVSGGVVGRPELGDTVVATFSEPADPNSLIGAWTGLAATDVVARIDNNVAAQGGFDALTVYDSSNAFVVPLGTIRLGRNDYVLFDMTYGASGTRSKLTQSANAVTLTLGTPGITPIGIAASTGTLTWFPAVTATDRAGNAMSATSLPESGTADKDF